MMFLEPSERVIIMQEAVSPFTVEECRALAGVGVKTIYLQGAVRWGDMQPKPDAPVEYASLDMNVLKCTEAGLKVLLPQLYQCPAWKADTWYFRRTANNLPNMADGEARADISAWTKALIRRYESLPVQVVYSVPENGEFPDADWPTSDHPVPNEVIASFVVEQMGVLAAQYGEVWTAFHHYGNPPYMDAIFSALKALFPACAHYSIQFTHFVHTWEWQPLAVARARELYGIQTFGGSEYCPGMDRYLRRAISEKVGYLTCPNHSFQPERRLTPQMLETIERTIKALAEADYA